MDMTRLVISCMAGNDFADILPVSISVMRLVLAGTFPDCR